MPLIKCCIILLATLITSSLKSKQLPHVSYIWETTLANFDEKSYETSLTKLLENFEKINNQKIIPGRFKKVGIKICTHYGKGLATPHTLVLGLSNFLEKRGFSRSNIIIVDLHESKLRATKYLPSVSSGENHTFKGMPVQALDTGRYWNKSLFYNSPISNELAFFMSTDSSQQKQNARKSFLPNTLTTEVDFWINLPMAMINRNIGLTGALANATLWNISNYMRFLRNPTNACFSILEMLTIEALQSNYLLTIMTLESYQYAEALKFNSLYSASEKIIWLSKDPLALDNAVLKRINKARHKKMLPFLIFPFNCIRPPTQILKVQ